MLNKMTTERIKEIQAKTAYPESHSVQQALLQVWNECEQAISEQSRAKSDLIDLLFSQVVDLTMMSKIELGDDVIEEIRRLRALILDTTNEN